MPWWIHSTGDTPNRGIPFTSKELAIDGLKLCKPLTKIPIGDGLRTRGISFVAPLTLTFVASDQERQQWTQRERERFHTGLYLRLPWLNVDNYPEDYLQFANGVRDSSTRTPFYGEYGLKDTIYSNTMLHFPHLSLDEPGMIAYTPDDAHGLADKQIRVRAGKYLAKFYGENFSQDKQDLLCAIVKSMTGVQEIKFATSADDIRAVYRFATGFKSCMDGQNFSREDDQNPVSVYGDSDLAVAYLGDLAEKKISARCVVWPDKKIFTRIYGDLLLRAMLLRAEWKEYRGMEHDTHACGDNHTTIHGARIRVIECENPKLKKAKGDYKHYVMPYIDGANTVELVDGWFVLAGSIHEGTDEVRTFTARSTDGHVGVANICDRCGDSIENDERLCSSCYGERITCNGCDGAFFSDETEMTLHSNHRGYERRYCESCEERYSLTCDHCDETYYADQIAPTLEMRMEFHSLTGTWCADCATTEVDRRRDEENARQAEIVAKRLQDVAAGNGRKLIVRRTPGHMIGEMLCVRQIGREVTIYYQKPDGSRTYFNTLGPVRQTADTLFGYLSDFTVGEWYCVIDIDHTQQTMTIQQTLPPQPATTMESTHVE